MDFTRAPSFARLAKGGAVDGLGGADRLVAIAGIGALAGVWPAIRLALLAGILMIGIAIVLRPFAFTLVRIIGDVVAAFGLARMILGQGNG
jgi:hypothetical protein